MKYLSLLLFSILYFNSNAQQVDRPKLVVGIVVDQMKFDYIYRYWNKLGDGGFKRLVREGFECSNTKYNYSPTVTGPGHASIYTGSTPHSHGIVSNDWYNRTLHKDVYCVDDSSVNSIGGSSKSGSMSPRNLLVNTIGDELKLATNFKAKVIGIALKDRGAILPAGHAANAAYWFDSKSGNWITSSYYMTELPRWVETFNALKYPEKYNSQKWNTLLEISQYTESTVDNTPYENLFKGETTPTFPHDFALLAAKDFENVRRSPFGNTLTKDFAKAAILNEQLGAHDVTDMLCLSFSSTDYIGHQFGTNAIETEDCYLRLDKDIEDLLIFLDKTIGKKNVLLFLTADHGAVPNPQFLLDHKFNAGFFDSKEIGKTVKTFLQNEYNDSLLFEALGDQCIYLNQNLIEARKLSLESITYKIATVLMKLPEIANAYPANLLNNDENTQKIIHLFQLGYNPSRSGDVYYSLLPNYIESANKKGTTHGAAYSYDTHVPLFFYGYNIAPGTNNSPINITDIAPTISSILKIEFPNGSLSNPIHLQTTK
ncbi:MAG: alkaline phosphatase family protein [Bacteroidetes bacterium]|nr:alkaline phosphatase family protein [Bacteroidota bacterium]